MAYLKGIDVSKWQDSTDWSPSGLSFIVARASIGTTADAEYDQHIAKAKAARLLTGAYHFNWDPDYSGTADPREQARFFLSRAGDVDFLFLDVEGAMAFETAECQAFIDEVHKAGKRIGLYMSQSSYKWNIGQDYDWVARWGSTQPSGDWEFWQYTSDGKALDGGRLDLDYFDGDLNALRALSNKEYGLNVAFTVFATPKAAVAQKGDWLYDNAACEPSTGNIMLDPGRTLPVSGRSSDGTVLRVGYVDTTPTETLLREMYVPANTVTLQDVVVKVDDGITQATVDAAVKAATEPLKASIASLEGQVAQLRTQAANLTTALNDAETARVAALAAQAAAEEAAAEGEAFRSALKAFIA